MTDRPNGLTYADAGVDIDAGNALVERIKPLAAATARPGVMAGLGGFGALFDLKAAGYADPVLVAATDGVGTKLRLAIDTGRLDSVGIDLVAMCVNDLVCQGAEPLFFLDYFATGKLDVDAAAAVIEGIAAGCAEAGARSSAARPPRCRGCTAAATSTSRASRSARWSAGGALPQGVAAGDVLIGLASSRRAFQRLQPGAAGRGERRARLGGAFALRRRDARRGAARADPHLRAAGARGDPRRRRARRSRTSPAAG